MVDGKELVSSKREMAVAENPPNTLKEQIERIIGSYLFQHTLHKQGHETLEEFEDFDTGEQLYDSYPEMEQDDSFLTPEDQSTITDDTSGGQSPTPPDPSDPPVK